MALITVGTFGFLGSVIALIVGIAILIAPKLLRFLIGFYLVIIGLLGLILYF